jgi:hypothetical protein
MEPLPRSAAVALEPCSPLASGPQTQPRCIHSRPARWPVELHAEISDRSQRCLRVILLKPCGGFRRLTLGFHERIDLLAEG